MNCLPLVCLSLFFLNIGLSPIILRFGFKFLINLFLENSSSDDM